MGIPSVWEYGINGYICAIFIHVPMSYHLLLQWWISIPIEPTASQNRFRNSLRFRNYGFSFRIRAWPAASPAMFKAGLFKSPTSGGLFPGCRAVLVQLGGRWTVTLVMFLGKKNMSTIFPRRLNLVDWGWLGFIPFLGGPTAMKLAPDTMKIKYSYPILSHQIFIFHQGGSGNQLGGLLTARHYGIMAPQYKKTWTASTFLATPKKIYM